MFLPSVFPRFMLLSLVAMLSMGCQPSSEPRLFKIAFGSCGHEDHPLPVFDRVVEHEPDLFIFLGDNIYGDTYDMNVLKAKYDLLASKPSFQNLKASVPIIATWDDHDFGWNDSGRHYPHKEESKAIFMEFFDEPTDSERRNRPGIYTSYTYPLGEKTLQVILLDTRTFRDDLRWRGDAPEAESPFFYQVDYLPYEEADSTLLGETQWQWLEEALQQPADIRIIGSSTQFGIEYNGYEAWANFPHEQQRFLDLIKSTQANGVLFLSGDVHYAELSRQEFEGQYPIYDFTSSGLSSTWDFATLNRHRIEGPIMDNHFGLLSIQYDLDDPLLNMEVWDVSDNQRFEYTISLSEISF